MVWELTRIDTAKQTSIKQCMKRGFCATGILNLVFIEKNVYGCAALAQYHFSHAVFHDGAQKNWLTGVPDKVVKWYSTSISIVQPQLWKHSIAGT